MDGEPEVVVRNITVNVYGDIYDADNVINTQIEEIEVKTLEDAVDDDEELSQQERNDLKERIDELEEGLDKENTGGVLNLLKKAKEKKADRLLLFAIKHFPQLLHIVNSFQE